MSGIKDVPVTEVVDGREFVNVNDFLACYPNTSQRAKKKIVNHLGTFDGTVEKRVEEPFVRALLTHCWNAPGTRGQAFTSPIVLRDGWVLWTDRGHEHMIDVLGELFVPRQEEVRDLRAKLAQLSREQPSAVKPPNTDLLTGGHAWYISTEAPKTIFIGEAYRPTSADRDIFKTFAVNCIF